MTTANSTTAALLAAVSAIALSVGMMPADAAATDNAPGTTDQSQQHKSSTQIKLHSNQIKNGSTQLKLDSTQIKRNSTQIKNGTPSTQLNPQPEPPIGGTSQH